MSVKSKVVKTAISLSPIVVKWGKALAEEKGFGANFSAYIADLIRRDKDNAEAHKRERLLDPLGDRDGNGFRKPPVV